MAAFFITFYSKTYGTIIPAKWYRMASFLASYLSLRTKRPKNELFFIKLNFKTKVFDRIFSQKSFWKHAQAKHLDIWPANETCKRK